MASWFSACLIFSQLAHTWSTLFTRSLPKAILRTWSGQFIEGKREPIPRLAFLGGHPRSGTTLLEQVLDAHPDVAALDEPTAFLDVLQPEFHKSKELSSMRLNALRRLYVQALLRAIDRYR